MAFPDAITEDSVKAGKLSSRQIALNFTDLHPPLDEHQAAVEAARCYFCYDAPCIAACPTEIDIPLFIRQIASGSPETAAITILESNILGGLCARVCPTESLCEEKCVRQVAEEKPVEIGLLQRFATDRIMARSSHPFQRQPATGRSVAVVGAGPAGLACAHRLAMKGHDVSVFERRTKSGGLNEYGIAAYKVVDSFAEREIEWLLGIGGIAIHTNAPVESYKDVLRLREDFEAVFLGLGLGAFNSLMVEGLQLRNVEYAVDFIERVRQAEELTDIAVGNDVVVIGGGMTAIDAAVQSKLIGADNVTILYRGDRSRMKASRYEQQLAAHKGVKIVANAQAAAFRGNGRVEEIKVTRSAVAGRDGLVAERLPADQVFLAIGQQLVEPPLKLRTERGKIAVDSFGRTSLEGVWAGGDCVAPGDDLSVTAVAQGRDAAEDIHASFGES